MIRLLLAIAVLFALIAWWLTSASAIDYDTDIDDNGITNAIDIAIVRSRFNVSEPTPTPISGGYPCARSYDGTNSHLTGSGWPQEYDGAEVHWLFALGEAFSTLTVTDGNASASVVGQATFAGVVGNDGQPYVCAN